MMGLTPLQYRCQARKALRQPTPPRERAAVKDHTATFFCAAAGAQALLVGVLATIIAAVD
jgi:hypothetical protein